MSSSFNHMKLLSAAIQRGDLTEIRNLLTIPMASEIVNMADSEGYNSIFHIFRLSNQDLALEILQVLLDKGANPYHKEENKQTVIFYLANEGKAKVIEKLLSTYKYDLNDLDKYFQNPLYWAAKSGRLKVAELLLRFGVNINHIDQNGQTCLFYAARDGQLEMCKFLVNRGCSYDLLDKNKKNPLHFAKVFKHHAVIEYFSSLKASKNKVPKQTKQNSQDLKQPKKKKQVQRNEYFLSYTNDEGNMNEVMVPELNDFPLQSDYHAKLWSYFTDPDKLQEVDLKKVDKKSHFQKIGNKIINNYLKRNDMMLFHEPVDTSKYLDYLDHVQRPMDFSTIKIKLNNNCYDNEEEFKNDVITVFQNCIKYNGDNSIYATMSKNFTAEFFETWRKENGLK